MGWIAWLLRHMAALRLLGMEWPFRVVAPCSSPQKPHTLPRPTAGFRIMKLIFIVEIAYCSLRNEGVALVEKLFIAQK